MKTTARVSVAVMSALCLLVELTPLAWAGAAYVRRGARWVKQPGDLAQIAVGSRRHVWGLTATGGILRWTGRAFVPVPGRARSLAVGADGTVMCTRRDGTIWRYAAAKRAWVPTKGRANRIAVGNAGHIWALARGSSVWRWSAGKWHRVRGRLRDLAVGRDGSVWGVRAEGSIWRYHPTKKAFAPVKGRLQRISVGSRQRVWGVNQGRVWRWAGRWIGVSAPPMELVAVGSDGTVWGIGSGGMAPRPAAVRSGRTPPGRTARPRSAPSRRSVPKPSGLAALLRAGLRTQSRLNRAQLRGLGELMPIATVVERLRKAEQEGEALPGSTLVFQYDQWKDAKRHLEAGTKPPPPPGQLTGSESEKDSERWLYKHRYLEQLLPELKNYVLYIYDKVFTKKGRSVACDPQLKQDPKRDCGPALAVDLLHKHGCKRISRLMPGFARVVKKRISKEIDLTRDWNQPIADLGAPKRKSKRSAGKSGPGPKPYKPNRVEVVEVCTITHAQLDATLRKDLEIIVKAVRPAKTTTREDAIPPLSVELVQPRLKALKKWTRPPRAIRGQWWTKQPRGAPSPRGKGGRRRVLSTEPTPPQAAGKTCYVNTDCASGFCNLRSKKCGGKAGAGKKGDRCTTDGECKAGLFCPTGTCQPPAGFGSRCSHPSHCKSGFCNGNKCGRAGGTGTKGQACRIDGECNYRAGKLTCKGGSCLPPVGVGSSCKSNLDCSTASCGVRFKPQKCTPLGGRGTFRQYCTSNRQCQSGYCWRLRGTHPGTCSPYRTRPLGEKCFTNDECKSRNCWINIACVPSRRIGVSGTPCANNNQCKSNVCKLPGGNRVGRCTAYRSLKLGTRCSNNGECKSGVCDIYTGVGGPKTGDWMGRYYGGTCVPGRFKGSRGAYCTNNDQCRVVRGGGCMLQRGKRSGRCN